MNIYRLQDGKLVKAGTTAKTSARIRRNPADEGYAVKAYVNGKWTKLSKSDIVTA